MTILATSRSELPRLEFAALIPKGDYVTLCLLGDDIDEELMQRFFDSAEIVQCHRESGMRRPIAAAATLLQAFSHRLVDVERLVGFTQQQLHQAKLKMSLVMHRYESLA